MSGHSSEPAKGSYQWYLWSQQPPGGKTNTDEKMGNFDWGNISAEELGGLDSGLSTMAAGFGDLFLGDRIQGQKELRDAASGDIAKFWERFNSGEFDAEMSPEMLKYFSMGRRETDVTPTLSAQATALESASNDPRALAASTGQIQTSTAKTMQDIKRKDFEQELQMTGVEGQAYQGIQDQNLDFMKQIYGDKLTQDQAAYAQALQNIGELEDRKRMAIPNIISGLVDTGATLYTAGQAKEGIKMPEYDMGGDVMSQIMGAQGQGDVPARQDLPGPEDHDSNPIDMIAPNGDKVGEATGGEIILNGEQTDQIESVVEVVDNAVKAGKQPSMEQLMAVYEAVSGILSKPQFQDEGEAEGQRNPQEERMMMFMNNKMA
jgi:hypothetical protein